MEDNSEKEMAEDTTKYGEFVCSAFHWLPPKAQKRQVKKMEQMTKNKI